MKYQLAVAAILLSCATSAFAQRNNNRNNNNNQGGQQNRNGGTLPLPQGVDRVISIDAYNILLAESKDEDSGDSIYTPIVVRHVYSGGMAALFGGTSIPTAQFVSPGSQNGGNGNGNGNNNRFGGGVGVGSLGGGNNGFNQGNNGFNQNGFNQGNNGFNNGFNQGNNGFNGVSGFNGTGFNNGFNGAGNGQLSQSQNGNFSMGQTSVVGPNGRQVPLANGPFFVR
ncbi:hypothetical protein IAD21_04166 [Abditibacteriota bacterium]|nr:hypothetical protein IAD21_04166 [Abditibacteriota bacterium]